MEVLVFSDADGEFTLYEEAGEGNEYSSGAFVQTKLSLRWGQKAEFAISPARGDLSLIPTVRTWNIGLRGWPQDAAQGQWEPQTNTLWITVTAEVTQPVTLTLDVLLRKRVTSLRDFGSTLTNPLTEQLTLTQDPFMTVVWTQACEYGLYTFLPL